MVSVIKEDRIYRRYVAPGKLKTVQKKIAGRSDDSGPLLRETFSRLLSKTA
jgi:hypothetical protein